MRRKKGEVKYKKSVEKRFGFGYNKEKIYNLQYMQNSDYQRLGRSKQIKVRFLFIGELTIYFVLDTCFSFRAREN